MTRTPSQTLRIAAIVTTVIGLIAAATAVTLSAFIPEVPSTPEEAALQLFDRAAAGDLPGMLETLAPSDRRAIRQPLNELAGQLHRLGLLAPIAQLEVKGIKVTTDSIRAKSVPYGEGLAAVDITAGRVDVRLDGEPAVLGERATRMANDLFRVDTRTGTATRDFAQYPLRLIAVNVDGGWFVSVPYTIAEIVRVAMHPNRPSGSTVGSSLPRGSTPGPSSSDSSEVGSSALQSGTGATSPSGLGGGSSPEEVVRQLMASLASEDPAGASRAALPEEAPLLADRSWLFPPVREQLPDPHRRGAISKLETSVEGSGDTRRVRVTALEATSETDVNRADISYDGQCFTARYRFVDAADPYATYTTCHGEPTRFNIKGVTGSRVGTSGGTERETENRTPTRGTLPGRDSFDQPVVSEAEELALLPGRPLDNPFSVLAVFGGGEDLPAFSVVEQDGRWFVSPIRSVLDSTADTLRETSPEQLDALVARVDRRKRAAADEAVLFEARDPDNALFGPAAVKDNPILPLCFVEVRETAGGKHGFLLYNECVEHLVKAGRIDPTAVRPSQLFVDCVTAQPTSPPALDNPYRRLYFADKASRDCFHQHFAAIGRVNLFDKLNPPVAEEPCLAPYVALERTAPESAWAAADTEVERCYGDG